MKTLSITYHTDPGHGWFETTIDMVKELGIDDQITRYSYVRGDKVFLEEDCDAYTFIQELKKLGMAYEIIENHTDFDSKIRNYRRYEA